MYKDDEMDLIKGKKKSTHLVPVKKMITRGGKTFETTIYVNPNKIDSVEEGGNVDIPIDQWQNIKTLADFDKCRKEILKAKDPATRDALKNEFVDFLRSSGVHFEKCPTNVNVEYMRCLSKAKKMIDRGEFVAKGNPEGHHKLQAPKLYKSKQEARALCQDFTKDFKGSREELHKLLKDNGVKWKECDHPGINHMRAMMELREMLEEGKDVPFMNEFQKDNPNYSKQQKILDKKRLASYSDILYTNDEINTKLTGISSQSFLSSVDVEIVKEHKGFTHQAKNGKESHVAGTMYKVRLKVKTTLPYNGKDTNYIEVGTLGTEENAKKLKESVKKGLKDKGYKNNKDLKENAKQVSNSYIEVKHKLEDINKDLKVTDAKVEVAWVPYLKDGSYEGEGFQVYVTVSAKDIPPTKIPLSTFGTKEKADELKDKYQPKISKLLNKFEEENKDKEEDKKQTMEDKKNSKEHKELVENFKHSKYSVQKLRSYIEKEENTHGKPKKIQICYSTMDKPFLYPDGVEDKGFVVGMQTTFEDGYMSYLMFEAVGTVDKASARAKAVTKTMVKHYGSNIASSGGWKKLSFIKAQVHEASKNIKTDDQIKYEKEIISDIQAQSKEDPSYENHEAFENKVQEHNSKLTEKQLEKADAFGKQWVEFKTAQQFNLWINGSHKAHLGRARKWWNRLKFKAQEYIKAYTGEGMLSYKSMNKLLRGIWVGEDDTEFKQEVKEACEEVTKAIDDFDLPENITLYRGVNLMGFLQSLGYNTADKSYGELKQLTEHITDEDMLSLKGGMYIDNAFLSASVTKNGMFDKPCVIKIRVPKGKGNVGYVSGYSKVGTGEEEVLINSNSKLYIHDVKKDSNGKFQIYCEMIDRNDDSRLKELNPVQHTSAWLNTAEGAKDRDENLINQGKKK